MRRGPHITIGSLSLTATIMDRFQYLILLGLCMLITLPLELVLGARVWRRPRRLLVALLPTAAVFLTWDAIAVARGHWSFSPRLTTGVEVLPGIPVDEVAFFVAIPICALLTLEAVRNVLAYVARRRA